MSMPHYYVIKLSQNAVFLHIPCGACMTSLALFYLLILRSLPILCYPIDAWEAVPTACLLKLLESSQRDVK